MPQPPLAVKTGISHVQPRGEMVEVKLWSAWPHYYKRKHGIDQAACCWPSKGSLTTLLLLRRGLLRGSSLPHAGICQFRSVHALSTFTSCSTLLAKEEIIFRLARDQLVSISRNMVILCCLPTHRKSHKQCCLDLFSVRIQTHHICSTRSTRCSSSPHLQSSPMLFEPIRFDTSYHVCFRYIPGLFILAVVGDVPFSWPFAS